MGCLAFFDREFGDVADGAFDIINGDITESFMKVRNT
jgi:hypothetical protein